MRVVISGSSGLIGSALTANLRADGHQVVPLVRSSGSNDPDAVEWDPMAGRIDADGLVGADAVVHLAGAGIGDKRLTAERRRVVKESRTKGTRLLAEAAAALDPKPAVFVSGSAMGIYGDGGNEVLTEASPPGDGFLSEVCVAWEDAAQPAVDAGIRVPFLRTSIVWSGSGGALGKLLPYFKLGLGGCLGRGRQWWSWISIDDEVGAIRWLLDHDISGPVNVTSPAPVTNKTFTSVLGDVLGRPTLIPVPAFGPKLVLGRERAELLLFLSQRLAPTVLEAHGYPFRHPDLESALRAVLHKPEST